MMTTRQVTGEARQLFRFCLVDGLLDEDRVRQVVKNVLESKRRGYLSVLKYFERLIKLELARHMAKVESALPLPPDLQTAVLAEVSRVYGPTTTTSFTSNRALIGGMRIQVGSDVYDCSVRSGLAALKRSLGITDSNESHAEIRSQLGI